MYYARTTFVSEQYRELDLCSRMSTASMHELITILYESLENALATFEAASHKGKIDVATRQLGRARSIIAALEAGLDFEKGGDLATMLAGIYRSMQRHLASDSLAPAAIAEVRMGVASLTISWKALAS